MGIISILSESVSDRISAGEVIERPGSAVKELVENALDAGATQILVSLEAGGRGLIEVQDNGRGMDPEDLRLSVIRHATSKLKILEDLESILSLGFRGEALPSIAAAAQLEILSRAQDQNSAWELLPSLTGTGFSEPAKITWGHFLGSPHGTRIRARGLFSTIPARLKFLKSPASELAHVREWLERIALTRPDVEFRLESDGRTALHLKAKSQVERVSEVLGDGQDFPVKIKAGPGIEVYWLQGLSLPHSRKMIQILNGRVLRDRLLQAAIMNAFRQALLPGKFPALLVKLEVPPSEIDVNVHPTKTEVRFIESQKIFQLVERTLSKLIEEQGFVGHVAGHIPQRPDLQTPFQMGRWQAQDSGNTSSAHSTPAQFRESAFSQSQYLGSAFQTYLLFDSGQELTIIDQHAADERVRYERLKAAWLSGEWKEQKQELLIPEILRLDGKSQHELENLAEKLTQLGFESELIGQNSLIFRSLPSIWGNQNLSVRLKELVEKISEDLESNDLLMDERLFEKLASQACRSSVMAGDRLFKEEALELTDQLFNCDHPWNCPHGRPTVVKLSKNRFAEWFQR